MTLPTKDDIATCLRGIIDPVSGRNIVDSGIARAIHVEPDGEAKLPLGTPAVPFA